jgi:hypothetical protein
MYILYNRATILSLAAHIGCVQDKIQAPEGVQPTRVDCSKFTAHFQTSSI